MQFIVCPKCGSKSVEQKWLNEPPVEYITIDEYVDSIGAPVEPMDITPRNYKVICRECGYSREYSR